MSADESPPSPRKTAARTVQQQPVAIRAGRASQSLVPARDALDRYLSGLHALPLLDAQQEIALAREIEALVTAHWHALLSYRPAFDALATVIHDTLGASGMRALAPLRRLARSPVQGSRARSRGASDQRRWSKDGAAAARRLRSLGTDSAVLGAADAAVQDAFAGESRARAYLERVARARDAQLRAKSRFVTANLRLVIAVARRYDRGLMPLADLIQEGNCGLMRAVERFDHRRGFRFSTYATWWIRHHVTRALADKARLVRIPVHALDDMSRVARAINMSKAQSGGTPSLEQLASETGISREKLTLLDTRARIAEPVSLDRNLAVDGERTLHDVLPTSDQPDPADAIDLDTWREVLEQLLGELSGIEATTLRLRFGLDGNEELTLREIGTKYNLSRERIRQIQEVALAKLRDALAQRRRDHDLAA